MTRTSVITPSGTADLRGSQWTFTNQSLNLRKTPGWAIVLAILFFPLGLLFLLAKEPRTTGYVQVAMTSGDTSYVVQIPVRSPFQVDQIWRQMQQAQGLAAAAAAGPS